MAEEPILWVRSGYQPPVTPTGDFHPDTGEPIVERLPVTAPPPADHPLAGMKVKRWDRWVDQAGNVIAFCYTGGAADYEVNATHGGARKARLRRAAGWFKYGECPLALVQAGMLQPRFLDKEMRDQPACAEGTYAERRPCPHTRHEAQRRKNVNAKLEHARSNRFRDETKSILEAAKEAQTAASEKQTEILQGLADIVKLAVGAGLMKKPDMQPNAADDPKTGNAVFEVPATEVALSTAPVSKDEELARLMDEADAELDGDPLVERAGVAPPVPMRETIEDSGPQSGGSGKRRGR